MGPSTYKMKKPAQFYVLYILSWALLALTACSFLGLLDLTTSAAEMEAQALQAFLGELLPLPDLKTIALGALTILTGWLAGRVWRNHGFLKHRGRGLMLAGAACIALTFTPASYLSLLIQGAYYEESQQLPVAIQAEDYQLYAVLGDGAADPYDVDILNPATYAPEGNVTGPCNRYKVCGALQNVGTDSWQQPRIEFVLVDEAGADILDKNGEPVVLVTERIQDILAGGIRVFETETVGSGRLSGQPAGSRVQLIEADSFY